MRNMDLHRYAIVVAISALVLIAVGAYVTSSAQAPQPNTRGLLDANLHRIIGVVVGILALFLALWYAHEDEASLLGWTAFALLLTAAWFGWVGATLLHASIAPLAFATLVAIVVITSSRWNEDPDYVDAQTAPYLRPLANAAPLLIALQTFLGAMYRHKVTGLTPHLAGAMIVSLATLVAATLAMQKYPKHRALRSAAIWLMSAVLTQVVLGVIAFVIQMLGIASWAAVVISTSSHVVVGALALAASLVLAMEVQRNVRKAAPAYQAELL